MANTQIPKSSTPVVVTLVVNSTGAGTTAPASAPPSFNVWLGGTKVVADTALGTLPITVNGLTVSAYTNNSVPFATSITIAVAPSTSLAASTGYIVNVSSPANNPSSGVFDIPVAWGYTATGAITAAVNGNYIPVVGTGATFNSATQYTNGTYFLGYTGTTWLIDTTINNGAIPTCTSPTTGANALNIPLSGWSGSASCTTPPIFTGITTASAFTITGAGLAASNGNYVPVTGANAVLNSATQYTNGTYFLAFVTTPGAPYWAVNGVVNAAYNSGQVLYNVAGGSATSVPLTGWNVASAPGVAPAPTLTAVGTFLVTPTTPTITAAVSLQMTANIGNAASEPAGTTYSILRGTTAGGESATPFQTGITALPYVFTESAAGSYFYKITATSGGVTTTSAEVNTTALNQQLTKGGAAAVVNLATGLGAGTTLVYGGTSCFNLWQAGVQVIPLTTIATLPVTVSGLTVSAEVVNATGQATSITLAVSAGSALATTAGFIINANAGNGYVNGVFDILAASAAVAPTALTSVAVTLADSGTAPNPTLTWVLPTSGTAYTGFNIRRGTTAGGESATPVNGSVLGAGVLSFVDTTAVYAGDYYYVVDGLWASGTVTTSELHIKSMTAAPTSLAATFGNSQVALTWVNATGALGIVVERTPQGANTWTTITTAATPITSFTDSTVVNGTAYSFRIRNLD